MIAKPDLTCFRIEVTGAGIAHLVFDLPGRPMNVLTNAAIHELGRFAAWLREGEAVGAVVRSAKAAFCAGADLTELGVAYEMIMAAPKPGRPRLAFDHFFPLSRAIRALETCGKPVAAAVSGLALGGGCELALGCHRRVLADAPRTALGLPESLVGLLPGAGGTQRMPRLVGVEAALPILLDGARLSPEAALRAGAADEVVPAGQEVAAAERWVLGRSDPRQPWDGPGWKVDPGVASVVAARRRRVLEETGGHYPAPLAILDCVERGAPEPMDRALVVEMEIFSHLIQRPEPRNMIRTLFVAKGEHEKRRAAGALPEAATRAVSSVATALARASVGLDPGRVEAARRAAGFARALGAQAGLGAPEGGVAAEVMEVGEAGPGEEGAGLWFEDGDPATDRALGARLIAAAAAAVGDLAPLLDEADARLVDYAVVTELGFPAYLGGPLALRRYLGTAGLGRLLSR